MSIVSPIQSIPPEMLEQIFIFCYNNNAVRPASSEAPFNITRVCSIWRDVAHRIPLLWASLRVKISLSSSSPSLGCIQTWLSRSGGHPLTLQLVLAPGDIKLTMSKRIHELLCGQVLEPLIAEIFRWEVIDIDMRQLPFHLDLPSISAPLEAHMLRHLEIRPNAPPDWWSVINQPPRSYPWLSILLDSAPLLSSFASHGQHEIIDWDIPWHQFTCVRLTGCAEIVCLDTLQKTPNVQHCVLSGLTNTFYGNVPTFTPAILRDLQSLLIHSDVDLQVLFSNLILPDLQNLEIYVVSSQASGIPANSEGMEEPFLTLLERSACPISALALHSVIISSRGLLRCLLILSNSLARLTMAGGPFNYSPSRNNTRGMTMDIIQALTYTGAHNFLCPHLEQLVLKCVTSSPDGMFSDMIESRVVRARTSSITTLHFVQVEFLAHEHEDDVRRLNELYAKGLAGSVSISQWCVYSTDIPLNLVETDISCYIVSGRLRRRL